MAPSIVNYVIKWPGVGRGSDKGWSPQCTKYCACACKTTQKHQNRPAERGGGSVLIHYYGVETAFRLHEVAPPCYSLRVFVKLSYYDLCLGVGITKSYKIQRNARDWIGMGDGRIRVAARNARSTTLVHNSATW